MNRRRSTLHAPRHESASVRIKASFELPTGLLSLGCGRGRMTSAPIQADASCVRTKTRAHDLSMQLPICLTGSLHSTVQRRPSARQAGFHGADWHSADRRRFLMRQFLRCNQDKSLPQQWRQVPDEALQVRDLGACELCGDAGVLCRDMRAQDGVLTPPPSGLLVESVTLDGEQPCLEVCPRRELVECTQRAHNGVLNEVVGRGAVSREKAGESSHIRQECRDLSPQHRARQASGIRIAQVLLPSVNQHTLADHISLYQKDAA